MRGFLLFAGYYLAALAITFTVGLVTGTQDASGLWGIVALVLAIWWFRRHRQDERNPRP